MAVIRHALRHFGINCWDLSKSYLNTHCLFYSCIQSQGNQEIFGKKAETNTRIGLRGETVGVGSSTEIYRGITTAAGVCLLGLKQGPVS